MTSSGTAPPRPFIRSCSSAHACARRDALSWRLEELPSGRARGVQTQGMEAEADKARRGRPEPPTRGGARLVDLLGASKEEEDVALGLAQVDLHDGEHRGVKVVGLGLRRVEHLDLVPAPAWGGA